MRAKLERCFWTLVTVLALVSLASPAPAGEKQPPKNTVAVVNGAVITRTDFDMEMSRVQQQLLSMGKHLTGSQLSEIKKEVLENLIGRELLYQKSQKKGIKVKDEAIKEQLATLKNRFPNEDEFNKALNEMNLSEASIKAQFKRNIAIQKLIDKEFAQKITISGKESKNYYDGNPDFFKQPEQIQASHILIKVDPQADESQKAEAHKKIETIQKKLQKGEDFAALAKEFSQCPSSSKGGDLGYFKRGQMVPAFEQAAFALKPGAISNIVKTRFGYHLIKVIDKKPETTIPYKDVKDKLEQYLKQNKVQKEVTTYVNKLKEKAKVERFLTENS